MSSSRKSWNMSDKLTKYRYEVLMFCSFPSIREINFINEADHSRSYFTDFIDGTKGSDVIIATQGEKRVFWDKNHPLKKKIHIWIKENFFDSKNWSSRIWPKKHLFNCKKYFFLCLRNEMIKLRACDTFTQLFFHNF